MLSSSNRHALKVTSTPSSTTCFDTRLSFLMSASSFPSFQVSFTSTSLHRKERSFLVLAPVSRSQKKVSSLQEDGSRSEFCAGIFHRFRFIHLSLFVCSRLYYPSLALSPLSIVIVLSYHASQCSLSRRSSLLDAFLFFSINSRLCSRCMIALFLSTSASALYAFRADQIQI